MDVAASLSECQRLLIMAAAVHDLGPRADWRRAHSAKVVRQAMHWAGIMQGAVLAAWKNYPSLEPERSAVIDEYYGTLIGMLESHEGSPAYFEGMGNFGGPDSPPAAPHFTVCRLTEAGAARAEVLLEQEPERRTDVLKLQCW